MTVVFIEKPVNTRVSRPFDGGFLVDYGTEGYWFESSRVYFTSPCDAWACVVWCRESVSVVG